MKDRIPRYAGRVRITAAGQDGLYYMDRADEPIQEGTPLNKNTLLSDETISRFGLTEDATPDDALRFLNARRTEFESEITGRQVDFEDEIKEIVSTAPQTFVGSYVGTGTYGEGNANTLTFSFLPKIVFIAKANEGTTYPYVWGCDKFSVLGSSSGYLVFRTNNVSTKNNGDGTYTVEWYSNDSDFLQLNVNRQTYNYVALR